jgi:hypothetical membrane protein
MPFFRRGLVGFALWSLCFQFFVGEQIARLGWPGPYSMTRDYISDLGAARSPLHWAMILLGLVSTKQWYGRMTLLLGSAGLLATLALMFRSGLGSEVGMVERLAAYPLPLWLTWTGLRRNAARASDDPIRRA